MPSIVPADVAKRIVAEYLDGAHTGTLAAKYGWSTSTLHRVYREAGIQPDRRRSGAASWVRRTNLPPDEGDFETGFRWCGDCRERKPMVDFYWRSQGDKPPARIRKCRKCYYKRTREKANLRANRRKYLYGMAPETYEQMYTHQSGSCAICREPATDDEGRGLNVDHCHRTGGVRGLLCTRCNAALGLMYDNPDYLRAAAEYVERGGVDLAAPPPQRVVDQLGIEYLASHA